MTPQRLEQFSRDLRNAVTNYPVDDRTWEQCRHDWLKVGRRLLESWQAKHRRKPR